MQRLPDIKSAYDWFFKRYEEEVAERAAKNDIAGIDQMEARRDTLERGIFVLMFGQFERAVDAKFVEARDKRSTNPDWTQRRGWDLDVLKGDRVAFLTRLSLVMDRENTAYKQIVETYGVRNHCAHGGTTDPVGSIDAPEARLYRWHSMLRA